jgi:hypothetical protein
MNPKRQDTDLKLQQGIQKHFKSKTISFGGGDHKIADVVGTLQSNVEAWNQHDQARLSAHQMYVKAEASEQATAPTRRALTTYIIAHFGESSPVLSDFGIPLKKDRRKLNTDERVMMVKRIRATRAARGTMSKRERNAIHGVVSDDSSDVTPAPTPAPAPVVVAPVAAPVAQPVTSPQS